MLQASKRELQQIELQWNPKVSLGVVMAAGGYPYDYEKGYTIQGLPHETENLKVCLLYTSPSPRDVEESRMPSSA